MQKLLLFLLVYCSASISYGQWIDDFSDGEFLVSPVWVGDTADFIVNSAGQLQLNAADPASSRLTAPVHLTSLDAIEWRFTIQLNFSPSSSNFARVYLVSDRDDFTGNGYFLQFGEALSNDAVELFRQDGTNYVSVCRAANGQIASAFSLGVKVTRDDVGVWRLFLDTNQTSVYHQVAIGAEGMYSSSEWTGISCTYTSANTSRFYFDDFYVGPLLVDTIPPQMVNKCDVIFSEIYFEPSSVAVIPYAEYVELYNRKDSAIELSGWTLSDGSSTARFPGRCSISPHSYLTVTSDDDTSLFADYGDVVGLSGFPALNNDIGDRLVLTDALGQIVDEVIFSDRSYGNSSKRSGGWSVERIDTSFICASEENWSASTNPAGGTPGIVNAVNGYFRDVVSPWIKNAWLKDSTTIVLHYSEPVDSLEMMNIANYKIITQDGRACVIDHFVFQDNTTIEIQLTNAIDYATILPLTVITDCSGNSFDTLPMTRVAFPRSPSQGDVVVNEILFDAVEGTSDFVELVNCSSEVIDLKNVMVAETAFESATIAGTAKVLTREHRLLFPGELFLFSEDERGLQKYYRENSPPRMQYVDDLPDFNSTQGGLLLLGSDGEILDRMQYNSEWHYPLLTETKGVSLERTTITGNGMDRSTWHSASGDVGYATPGMVNSQRYESGDLKGEVRVDPVVFSPGNDGNADVMMLSFHFPDPGRMVACRIFSSTGRLVRFLVNNELIGNDGAFPWDGTDDNNQPVLSGRYIVFMETIAMSGQVNRYRLGCGVVY